MLGNSLKLRGARIAYLFGPPTLLSRNEASELYNRVCEKTGLEMAYRYEAITVEGHDAWKGFRFAFEYRDGRRLVNAAFEYSAPDVPIRMLLQLEWPESLTHAIELAELTCGVTLESARPWQFVLAEVRLHAQCATGSKDAPGYLRSKLTQMPRAWQSRFDDRAVLPSLKFVSEAGVPGNDELAFPRRDLLVETLNVDPSSVYLELVSQWPQLAPQSADEVGRIQIDPTQLRKISPKPRPYLENAWSFLQGIVEDLPTESERGEP